MTLKVRNRLIMTFISGSIACIAIACAFIIIAFAQKAVIPPPVFRNPPMLYSLFPFTGYSFTATMLSTGILILYVPITAILLFVYFEKTQATEVIFFIGFLAACLCEGLRLVTPLFGLWQTYSALLLFAGRIVFLGRVLAPLSFICLAIMSESSQRQEIERNTTIMYAVSIVFAIVMPIDTARINSACTVCWGFDQIFFVIRVLLIIATFMSFNSNAIKRDSKEQVQLSFAFLIIMSGYALLVSSDNYAFLTFGTALLYGGTGSFLFILHRLYLWK
jgi:hypothetical protein